MGMSLLLFLVSGFLPIFSQASYTLPKPEKVPVKLTIDPDFLADLSPEQKTQAEGIVTQLEASLYDWANLPLTLPPSVFEATTPLLTSEDLFQAPNSDELRELAAQSTSLNENQLKQIRRDGTFEVPSLKYPGQVHVWEVSVWLQKGSKDIEIEYKKGTGSANTHVHVHVPELIWGNASSNISLKKGFANIGKGLRESVGLILGLSERKPLFTPDMLHGSVNQIRTEERANLLDQKHPYSPWPLYNEELMAKALPHLEKIQEQTLKEWTSETQNYYAQLFLKKNPKATNLEVFNYLEDLLQNRFFDQIHQTEELDKLHPHLGQIFINRGHFLKLLSEHEQNIVKTVQKYRALILENTQDTHIRGALTEWANNEADKKTTVFTRKTFGDGTETS